MKILTLVVVLLNIAYALAGAVYKVVNISTTLNIRKTASTSGTVVGSLKNGQYIYATEFNSSTGWARFYKGYVSTKYLAPVSGGSKYQTTSNLNFRAGPNTSSTILKTLNAGTTVVYYARDPFTSTWGVTNQGYASMDYLKIYSSVTTKKTSTIIKKTTTTIKKTTTTKKTTTVKKTTTTTKKPTVTNSTSVKNLVTTLLISEEGVGKYGVCGAYIDSRGYPTIGYGKLCKSSTVSTIEQARTACSSLSNGCTAAKAKQWLSNDIDSKTSCIKDYANIKAAYDKASDKRKAIITSMAYQMGCAGLAKFTNTLKYMANGDWTNASKNMLDSAWARQTPNRANRHAYVIKNNSCGDFCKQYGW